MRQQDTAARPHRKKAGGGASLLLMLLMLALLGGMAFSGWQLFKILSGYHRDKATYDALAGQVLTQAPQPEEQAPTPWPQVDWAALQAIDPEVVGWLYSPDTAINYPVAQTDDNDYYLHHTIEGEYSGAGTLFADCGSVLGPVLSNYIVYGHHMKDGSMFQSLGGYVDQAYYEEHPFLYYLTPDAVYRIELIAGSTVESAEENYPLTFADAAAYRAFLEKAIGRSSFSAHIGVSTQYQMMSLSTCSYSGGFEDPRTLLHGLMIPVA